jgi:hypothetical protein
VVEWAGWAGWVGSGPVSRYGFAEGWENITTNVMSWGESWPYTDAPLVSAGDTEGSLFEVAYTEFGRPTSHCLSDLANRVRSPNLALSK